MFSVTRPFSLTIGALFVVGLLLLGVGGCTQEKPAVTETTYAFWPAAPDVPRVQFLTSYSTSQDVDTKQSKFDEMLYGKAEGVRIIKPYGIAMWEGRIYVTDLRTRGVIVLDVKKHETRMMGAGGRADVQKPIDVVVAPDGTKYVIDSNRNSIVIFDADERYVSTITMPDFNPVALAVYQNELYVSDFTAAVVKVIDARSGKLLRTIGKPGPQDGAFVRPLSLRIDNDGNLLVADVFKCRVQRFTREGQFLDAFGQTGNRAGDFVRPKHMAVDRDGLIYIVDAAFNNVQVFDQHGKIVGFFGSMGAYSGSMDLPAGLCISESDADLGLFQQYVHPAFEAKKIVVVSNQFGPQKVSVYAVGALRPGKTVADVSGGRADTTKGLADATQRQREATTQPITIGRPLPANMTVGSGSATTSPVARPGTE